jgi:hypothetical protein
MDYYARDGGPWTSSYMKPKPRKPKPDAAAPPGQPGTAPPRRRDAPVIIGA